MGRPRRFDGETERNLLMDAAIEVMTGSDYLEISVGDVMAAAGVSTRSFYRHFESKDALLVAVMRRDAEAVGQLLDHAVSSAPNPAAAVQAWLDGYLGCFYEPKRARRIALYASPGANASPAVVAEHEALHQILVRSLTKALRAGTPGACRALTEAPRRCDDRVGTRQHRGEPAGQRTGQKTSTCCPTTGHALRLARTRSAPDVAGA